MNNVETAIMMEQAEVDMAPEAPVLETEWLGQPILPGCPCLNCRLMPYSLIYVRKNALLPVEFSTEGGSKMMRMKPAAKVILAYLAGVLTGLGIWVALLMFMAR